MLKIQTLNDFLGFGSGKTAGEYHYSQNMKRVQDGLAPAWTARFRTDTNNLPNLHTVRWFTELGGNLYSLDSVGRLAIGVVGNDTAWTDAHDGSAHGQGLIADQTGRLLYVRDDKLGMYDGSWNDTWKSFDTTVTDFCQPDLYEDWVAIARGNKVALLNVTDDSFNNTGFDLPSGFNIRCLKSGKTGILLGANIQNRGYLILFQPGTDRSITPWIPLDTTISSITTNENGEWIVTTARNILKTNGYSITPYATIPGAKTSDRVLLNVYPQGTTYSNGRFYLALSSVTSLVTRIHRGVFIYTEETGLWEFVSGSGNRVEDLAMTALFLDSNLDIHFGYTTTVPTVITHIDRLREGVAPQSAYITPVLADGPSWKHADSLLLTFAYDANKIYRANNYNWTVTAKIYNFDRELYGYGFSAGTSPALNQFVNLASNQLFKGALVGDEVTFLSGSNAGAVRTIIAIAGANTSSETWTFDTPLVNLALSGDYVEVTPFKLISVRQMRAGERFLFDIKNRPLGKRFLVKLIVSGDANNTLALPVLSNVAFIFNDLGIT